MLDSTKKEYKQIKLNLLDLLFETDYRVTKWTKASRKTHENGTCKSKEIKKKLIVGINILTLILQYFTVFYSVLLFRGNKINNGEFILMVTHPTGLSSTDFFKTEFRKVSGIYFIVTRFIWLSQLKKSFCSSHVAYLKQGHIKCW